jgi:hypothetical protein
MEAETGGLIMQFGVRGAIAALLSIIPTICLTGCETTGSSPVAATGSSSAIANNPHPDLPTNYRKQIADFMRTQRGDAFGLVPFVIHQGKTVEIGNKQVRAFPSSEEAGMRPAS